MNKNINSAKTFTKNIRIIFYPIEDSVRNYFLRNFGISYCGIKSFETKIIPFNTKDCQKIVLKLNNVEEAKITLFFLNICRVMCSGFNIKFLDYDFDYHKIINYNYTLKDDELEIEFKIKK